MINDNVLEKIGDSLIIRVMPKIIGKVRFTSFVDSIVGLYTNKKITREFRISTDDIFWGSWIELNNTNLSENEYVSENNIIIEIRYTRTGTDNTGIITFLNIQFNGNRGVSEFSLPTIDDSIFANVIRSEELKKTTSNIFKKMYHRGVLPKYITRAENSDRLEDKDFIDLFHSVAKFFGMFIHYFKRFENFQTDFDLMREQIRQYGLYFDESSITLEELQYLGQNIYDEIRKRGTEMIFVRKGDVISGNIIAVNGEFVRLLRNKTTDELLYENIPIHKTGWCLGNSSPMYKGTSQAVNLNKTKENTKYFQNIDNFMTTELGSSSIEISNGELSMSSNSGNLVGLGRSGSEKTENLYPIEIGIDYEITFLMKVLKKGDNANLTFGVEGFDIYKNKLNDSFVTPNGESLSETFFYKNITDLKQFDSSNEDVWYQVRGIIYAYSSSNKNEIKTNCGYGTNLYFNNSFTKYILPKILLRENSSNESIIKIFDYKIRPLVRGKNIIPLKDGTEYSHSFGFVQSSRFFYTYVKNNNNNQSKEELTNIIEKYLYPFNTTNIFIFI